MLVLVAGCGSSAQLPAAPADAGDIEARALDVYTRISGSARQREAANYLEWLDLNASYWSCLEQKGFAPVKEFSPLWTGWVPNPTSGHWMGSLGVKPSIAALGIAESSRAESDPPRSEEANEEYEAASDSCQSGSDVTVGGGPGTPKGAAQLTTDFKKLVKAVDAQLGPIDDYRGCMEDAGIDYVEGADGDEGWQGLYQYLTSEMPQAPLAGEKPSKKWENYLVLENKALEADESCRGEKYRLGLSMLAPGIEEFASNRADQIDEVAAGWATTVEQALAEGFTG
jgi:hypothetical protein